MSLGLDGSDLASPQPAAPFKSAQPGSSLAGGRGQHAADGKADLGLAPWSPGKPGSTLPGKLAEQPQDQAHGKASSHGDKNGDKNGDKHGDIHGHKHGHSDAAHPLPALHQGLLPDLDSSAPAPHALPGLDGATQLGGKSAAFGHGQGAMALWADGVSPRSAVSAPLFDPRESAGLFPDALLARPAGLVGAAASPALLQAAPALAYAEVGQAFTPSAAEGHEPRAGAPSPALPQVSLAPPATAAKEAAASPLDLWSESAPPVEAPGAAPGSDGGSRALSKAEAPSKAEKRVTDARPDEAAPPAGSDGDGDSNGDDDPSPASHHEGHHSLQAKGAAPHRQHEDKFEDSHSDKIDDKFDHKKADKLGSKSAEAGESERSEDGERGAALDAKRSAPMGDRDDQHGSEERKHSDERESSSAAKSKDSDGKSADPEKKTDAAAGGRSGAGGGAAGDSKGASAEGAKADGKSDGKAEGKAGDKGEGKGEGKAEGKGEGKAGDGGKAKEGSADKAADASSDKSGDKAGAKSADGASGKADSAHGDTGQAEHKAGDSAEAGSADGHAEAKPASPEPEAAAAEPAPIDGEQPQVEQPPPMPDVRAQEGKSQQGMATPHIPIAPAQSQKGGAKAAAAKTGIPGAGGGGGGGADTDEKEDGPQKTEAQLQAEAQQVAAAAKGKLGTAEKGLQEKAKGQADEKKGTAEKERDSKERAERQKGEQKKQAEEQKGEQKKRQTEQQGEQKKTQAKSEGKTQEAQAKQQGEQKKQQAEQQKAAQTAAEKQREQSEKARLEAEKRAETTNLKAKNEADKARIKAEGEQKKAQEKAKGEQDKAQEKAKGEQDKAKARSDGQAKAAEKRSQGRQQAQQREQQGQREAEAKKQQGAAEKARLEREAASKKDDGGLWGSIKSAVSSAFNSLMSAARSVWDAAVSAASSIINAAKAAAQALIAAAEQAAQAVLSAMEQLIGDIVSRIANAISAIVSRVAAAIQAVIQQVASAIAAAVNALSSALSALASRIASAIAAVVNAVRQAIQTIVNLAKKAIAAAVSWVKQKVQAIAKWVGDKIAAAVAWVKSTVASIVNAVKNAIKAIATAVASAVQAAYKWAAEKIAEAGKWLGEQWEKFSKWAQEAFVKFWTGPWRDVLIGIAVAAVIAAVTVATGGAGLVVIVAVSAGATAALRAGGEIAARRCAVAIKNDPERAARFEQEMSKTGGAEWYAGVDKNEGWGDTLKHGAIEGARGAVEGAVSGLVGGAGGAIGGKIAASVGKTALGTVGKTAVEWGARTAVDAGLNIAGNVTTGTVNAAIDSWTTGVPFNEAWHKRVDPVLSPQGLAAQVVGSGISSGMSLGHQPKTATTPEIEGAKDRLLGRVFGSADDQAGKSITQRIAREASDATIQGTAQGVAMGVQAMANGESFADGFERGMVAGAGGHLAGVTARSVVPAKKTTPTAAGEAPASKPQDSSEPAAPPKSGGHEATSEAAPGQSKPSGGDAAPAAAVVAAAQSEQVAASKPPVHSEQGVQHPSEAVPASVKAQHEELPGSRPAVVEKETPPVAHEPSKAPVGDSSPEHQAAQVQQIEQRLDAAAQTKPGQVKLSPEAEAKFHATATETRKVTLNHDGTAHSDGPDGKAVLHIGEDGNVYRTYAHPPIDEAQANARVALVMEESRAISQARDAQVKANVDAQFAKSGITAPDGSQAIVIDKVIIGAGGGAVQDYATHSPQARGAQQNGVPEILSLAGGGDPWQQRKELMGQTPAELSKPNGLSSQPVDYAVPNSPYAKSQEYAAAVADTRAKSGMPVYESKITAVHPDNSNPPARYRVDIEVPKLENGQPVHDEHGRPVMEKRAIYANNVDVATGPGPDRSLASTNRNISPEYEAQLKKQGVLSYGDAAVGQTFNENEKVLISGGGATSAWGAQRAHDGGSQVDWIARPGAVEPQLRSVEAGIQSKQSQLAALPEGHPQRAQLEAEIRADQQTRDGLLRQEKTGPFANADLERNEKTMNNPNIHRHGKEIATIEGPFQDGPNAGQVLVRFSDGSEGHYHKVVVGHGQDAAAKGGVHDLLYGQGQGQQPGGEGFGQLKPIYEMGPDGKPTGKVLGLQTGDSSEGGGLRILGAAATAPELSATKNGHMDADQSQTYRDALDARSHHEDVSQHSKGVGPGIEVWADSWKKLNGGSTDFGKTGGNDPQSGPTLPPTQGGDRDASQRSAPAQKQADQEAVAKVTGGASDAEVARVSTQSPEALPDNLKDRAYDGTFVGQNGKAYASDTPLSEVPGVLPKGLAPGAEPKETILYVNGIQTSKDAQAQSLQSIADQTGARVVGIHNATQGMGKDLLQCVSDKMGVGRNPAVDQLTDVVLAKLEAGESVHLMAHSQGGLITSRALRQVSQKLAAQGLSPAEIQTKLGLIHAETFGAAAYSYPDGPKYEHYVNQADPVPRMAGLGGSGRRDGKRAGSGATVHRFRDNQSSRGDWFGSHDFDLYLEHRARIAQEQSSGQSSPVAGGDHTTPDQQVTVSSGQPGQEPVGGMSLALPMRTSGRRSTEPDLDPLKPREADEGEDELDVE